MLTKSRLNSLKALISMVDEPDEKVYFSLKNQVLSYEEDALPTIEEAWMAATDILVASRLEELIGEINFRILYNRLSSWIAGGSKDLIKAMFLINRLEHSSFKENIYQNKIEHLYKDAWLEMNDNLTALEKTKVLNHIFFTVHKYKGNYENTSDVQDFLISHLLETKEGNPTSIGILYLSIAQYLKLPVFGVNLPGHLILSYLDDRYFLKQNDTYNRDDILFYINPFNNGAVFTESEIDLYIKQMKLTKEEHYFLPTSNKQIIIRYLRELQISYSRENNEQQNNKINKLLELF